MNLTHLNSAHLVENFILYGLLLKKKMLHGSQDWPARQVILKMKYFSSRNIVMHTI